jgi:hypothetical protein
VVIIRVNARMTAEQAQAIVEGIHNQAPAGVIVVPSFCELLYADQTDPEIQVRHEGSRVAELEAELAAAMEYITAEKACITCKHDNSRPACPADCDLCKHAGCYCGDCIHGSKWEWRGAHGRD